MIWLRGRTDQIQPALDSIRYTFSQHQRRADTQETLVLQKTNWKMIGNLVSLIIFTILLLATVIGVPTIITKVKKDKICSGTTQWTTIPTPIVQPAPMNPFIPQNLNQLCTENAEWNLTGITVAGLPNGLSSTALNGLKYPYDIYVYDDGTILIADSGNNRITKWNPNAAEGENIAGTGAYGSWINLLADPMALAVQGNALYVSDVENYRIQMFPLNSSLSSPDAMTIIGCYGQGSSLMQINQVTSLLVPISNPSLLLMADSKNHRILSWNSELNYTSVVAGKTGLYGSNLTLLNNPHGIVLDERTNSLYIADTLNNRIQKYDMNTISAGITVAGWGELNNPTAVQLDPSGTSMFIADTLNHRILLWFNGALKGHMIAGNGIAGNSATQLNNPSQIRFDSNYNLYVVDTNNSRIQRFDLVSNGC